MPDIERSFPPGSRWAYLKMYCGEMTADRLLGSAIPSLAGSLEADGMVTHWFFIRYLDPSHHLRVRFHLADRHRWQELLARVHERLAGPVRDGLVWKIQADTYERELERYGAGTMELSERLFHRDSELVARALSLIHEAGNEDWRWQFGLLAMTRLLDGFEVDPGERLRLLDAASAGLLAEYGAASPLGSQIDRRYRELRTPIEQALDGARPAFGNGSGFADLLEVRARATEADRHELARLGRDHRLTVPLDALYASYLHMFCNRLFVSRQRLHELVLTRFLAKHVRSRIARTTAGAGTIGSPQSKTNTDQLGVLNGQ